MDDAWDMVWRSGQILCTALLAVGGLLCLYELYRGERPAVRRSTPEAPAEPVLRIDLHKAA